MKMQNIKVLTSEISYYDNNKRAHELKIDYVIDSQFLITLHADCRNKSSITARNYKTGSSLYRVEFQENLYNNDNNDRKLAIVLQLFKQKLAILHDISENDVLLLLKLAILHDISENDVLFLLN